MLQSTQEGRKRSKQPAVLHGSAQGPGEWTVSTRRPCGGCKQPSTGDLTTWIFAEQNWNRKGGCFNLGDAKMAIWQKRIVINHVMMVWSFLRFHTSPRRSGGFLQDFKHWWWWLFQVTSGFLAGVLYVFDDTWFFRGEVVANPIKKVFWFLVGQNTLGTLRQAILWFFWWFFENNPAASSTTWFRQSWGF